MMSASAPASLLGLATAVPDNVFETSLVMEESRRIFADRLRDFERLAPIFVNTGIERRYSGRPLAWFQTDQGWPERSAAYLDAALSLYRRVAPAALAEAGISAGDVDTIVTVSSTGIATPTLEARVMEELGFRSDVRRVPVFGLGCAGGVTGLAIGSRLAAAEPGTNVLVVVIELCTLAFRRDELTKANIIATALFGDGAAAVVLAAGNGRGDGAVELADEHTWPDTLDIMGWRMDPVGFGAIFQRSIPEFVMENLRRAADAFLARHDLGLADIAQFVFHPGGTKVVQALETAFELPQGTLRREREVLADYGNMSAATVLFVLDRARREAVEGRRLLAALGPGFTASFLTMVT